MENFPLFAQYCCFSLLCEHPPSQVVSIICAADVTLRLVRSVCKDALLARPLYEYRTYPDPVLGPEFAHGLLDDVGEFAQLCAEVRGVAQHLQHAVQVARVACGTRREQVEELSSSAIQHE